MRFWMRNTCFSNFFQGSLLQGSLTFAVGSAVGGAFLSAIGLTLYLSIQQCRRLRIRWLSQRRLLLRQSSHQAALAGTYSPYRLPVRADLWLSRSNLLFCTTVDLCSPPDTLLDG